MRAWLAMLCAGLALGCTSDPHEPAPALVVPSRYVLVSIDDDPLPAGLVSAGDVVAVWSDTLELSATRAVRHRYLMQRQGEAPVWVVEHGTLDTADQLKPDALLLNGQLSVRADGGVHVLTRPDGSNPNRRFQYRRVAP